MWDKAKDFLQRAFTVIFLATIAIWFLQNFDTGLNMVSDSHNSILALAAGWLAPLFAPVGFGDWRIVTALISGFMAKESVVSTLSVRNTFVKLTAFIMIFLLLFLLFYSYRNDSTGFREAARQVCNTTVRMVISKMTSPDTGKSHQLIVV